MKKYKLLKHIDNEDWNEIELWKIFELNTGYFHFNDWGNCPINFLIKEWYMEEIIEWKIWDNFVKEYDSWVISFNRIIELEIWDNIYINGININNKGYKLRKPTQEELEIYFN